ncbi:MAG TPA: hypothetical protein VGN82_23205 [Bosea sp. (in: a-proteobacteria)]|jgi:hypothetical protein|uniref:hypothetical protein n=1 Tax=Bosea sp. (in: a-proteobacteria) TaxID=1871050 RepID=UPI002E10BAA1|nr:hypothetical protein [Bosea sp. (in: a-proteobacteria)]
MSRDDMADRQARRLHRDLSAILFSAAGALIDQYHSVGIGDPADIARRLNRRGFPCFGRGRWTAGAVKAVLRRQTREAMAGEDDADACPVPVVSSRTFASEQRRAS